MSKESRTSEGLALAADLEAAPNEAADLANRQKSMARMISLGVNPAVAAALYGFGQSATEALAPGGVPSVESNGAQEE